MSITTQLQQLLRTLLPDKGFKTAGHHRDAIIAGVEEAKTYTDEKASEAVKKTGNETITGIKTFSDGIVGNVTGNASTVTNGVYASGNQTIGGVKTFTSSPVVPDAVNPQNPVTLNQGVLKTQIKQETGTSTTDFMSQNAVTDTINTELTSVPRMFEGYTNLVADVELTMLATDFEPTLNLKPASVQVFYNGELKPVSVKYAPNGDNYDIKLTSPVDLLGAEVFVQAIKSNISEVFDSGKLILTFDDGHITVFTELFPWLQSEGISATSYLIGSYQDLGNVSTYSWADAKLMQDAGIDIQSHTYSHPNLTTKNEEGIIEELTLNNSAFIENGLVPPQHLAYPGGAYNLNVINAVKNSNLIKTARAYYGYVYNNIYRDNDKYSFPSLNVDNIDETAIVNIKNEIDKSALYKTALILTGHAVNTVGGTSTIVLKDIIDYARIKGLEIINISKLYAKMNKRDFAYPVTTMTVKSLGNGTVASKIVMNFYTACKLTISGGKFYTDAAGTLGESDTWNVVNETNQTIYFKCTSGTATITFPMTKTRRILSFTTYPDSPSIAFDISKLTYLMHVELGGVNGVYGDISQLSRLQYCFISSNDGTNAVSVSSLAKLKNIAYLYLHTASGVLFPAGNINQILADLWANKDEPRIGFSQRSITLIGKTGSLGVSGQGITDRANLRLYRSPNNDAQYSLWTIDTR